MIELPGPCWSKKLQVSLLTSQTPSRRRTSRRNGTLMLKTRVKGCSLIPGKSLLNLFASVVKFVKHPTDIILFSNKTIFQLVTTIALLLFSIFTHSLIHIHILFLALALSLSFLCVCVCVVHRQCMIIYFLLIIPKHMNIFLMLPRTSSKYRITTHIYQLFFLTTTPATNSIRRQ